METIVVEQGPVAWIWLHRPHRLNAINPTTLAELRQAFATLGQEEAVRAIVLAARGPAFSAGFDIQWMAGLEAGTVAREISDVRAVYDVIEACPRPLVAAIQGAAVGGGLLLTLLADLRIASEQASFSVPEVKLGFFPPLSLAPRLERLVGLAAAKRMVLIGDTVDAAQALHIGLVDRVVPADALHSQARGLAEQLAALPPQAVRLSKAAFSAARHPNAVEWETEQLAACWASPERQAAMQAFLKERSSTSISSAHLSPIDATNDE